MNPYPTTETPKKPPPPTTLLVGNWGPLTDWMQCCPRSRCTTGYSMTLQRRMLIATNCKQWSCPVCGRRKVAKYAKQVEAAKPNRLITLTVDPKLFESPRHAYDLTRRKVPKLLNTLRQHYGEVECFRVLEVTKKGWPHYHLVTRSAYIPHCDIKAAWSELTGATIVDVRAIKHSKDVYFYVVKYLAKQEHIEWTTRRVAWTKQFFPPSDFIPSQKLELEDTTFHGHRADQFASYNLQGFTLQSYSRDAWIVIGPNGSCLMGSVGPVPYESGSGWFSDRLDDRFTPTRRRPAKPVGETT